MTRAQGINSTGGYLKFSTVKGTAAYQTVSTFHRPMKISATGFVLNMSSDVCQLGPAGTTWGFRDMGMTWSIMDLDLAPNAGRTIYYVVGDSKTESKEYEFRVPPAPGSSKINILACECAWVTVLQRHVAIILRLLVVPSFHKYDLLCKGLSPS